MKKILLTILLLVLTFGLGLCLADDIKGWFDKPDNDTTDENQDVGNGIITGVENNSVFKLSTRSVSNNGASLDVVASFDEHANVNKLVDWSLSWNGSGNVNEYVSLNVSEDTLTCGVRVLKGFTTQIKLTCTLRSNTNLTAVCNIDYVGRTVSFDDDGSKSVGEYSLHTMTYRDLVIATGICNPILYSLSGGSVQGELTNIEVEAVEIATDGYFTGGLNYGGLDGKISDYVESRLQNFGMDSLSEGLWYVQDDAVCGFHINADVIYNGVVVDTISEEIWIVAFDWGELQLSPTKIELNESQLIF